MLGSSRAQRAANRESRQEQEAPGLLDASDSDSAPPGSPLYSDSESDSAEAPEPPRMHSRRSAQRAAAARARDQSPDASDALSESTVLLQSLAVSPSEEEREQSQRARRPRRSESAFAPRAVPRPDLAPRASTHMRYASESDEEAPPPRRLNAATAEDEENKYEDFYMDGPPRAGRNDQLPLRATRMADRRMTEPRAVERTFRQPRGNVDGHLRAQDRRAPRTPAAAERAVVYGTPPGRARSLSANDNYGDFGEHFENRHNTRYERRPRMDLSPASPAPTDAIEQTLINVSKIATSLAQAQMDKTQYKTESTVKEVIAAFRHQHPRTTIGAGMSYFENLTLIFEVFHLADRNNRTILKALRTLADKHSQLPPNAGPDAEDAPTFSVFLCNFTQKHLQTTRFVSENLKAALRDINTRPRPMHEKEPGHHYVSRARDFISNLEFAMTACGCAIADQANVIESFMVQWIAGAQLTEGTTASLIAKYTTAQREDGAPTHPKYISKVGSHLEARSIARQHTPKEEKGQRQEDDYVKREKPRHQRRPEARRQPHVPRVRDDEPRYLAAAPAAASYPVPLAASYPAPGPPPGPPPPGLFVPNTREDLLAALNLMSAQGSPVQAQLGRDQERKYPPRACEAPGHRHDVMDCPEKARLCNQHGNAHPRTLCSVCHNCGDKGHYAKECINKCRECDSRPHVRGCRNGYGASTAAKRPREDEDRARSPRYKEDRPRSDDHRSKRARSLGNGTGRRR